MKKLNITKEAFNKSHYFQTKYGKLEYVSESGKVYKTSKGKLVMFNERNQSKQKMIEDFIDGILQREFGDTITSHVHCYRDQYNVITFSGVDNISVHLFCEIEDDTPTYSISGEFGDRWFDKFGEAKFEERRKDLNLISFLYNNFKEIQSGLQKLDACNNL